MYRKMKRFFRSIRSDVHSVFERDPAAKSVAEVIFTYSGLHAIWLYRVARFLYVRKWFFLSKIISQCSRFLTGIEIHPGASIGCNCFIDHGVGVVIGQTCQIGNHVTIYQGVTLGGTGKEKGKRHPTIEDYVMISSGAKILGSISVGRCSKVGAGSVVLKDVPPYSTVVGVPGRIVAQNGMRVPTDLDHVNLPDPVNEMLRSMQDEIMELQKKIILLEKEVQKVREKKN